MPPPPHYPAFGLAPCSVLEYEFKLQASSKYLVIAVDIL